MRWQDKEGLEGGRRISRAGQTPLTSHRSWARHKVGAYGTEKGCLGRGKRQRRTLATEFRLVQAVDAFACVMVGRTGREAVISGGKAQPRLCRCTCGLAGSLRTTIGCQARSADAARGPALSLVVLRRHANFSWKQSSAEGMEAYGEGPQERGTSEIHQSTMRGLAGQTVAHEPLAHGRSRRVMVEARLQGLR